jgi:23S rRNA pseudouridine2605 synthase
MAEKMRLQKIISMSGITSRRKAEELIKKGLVKVNGRVSKIGDSAMLTDYITISGEKINIPQNIKHTYVMLNKPTGVITSMQDEKGRLTVREYMEDVGKRIYPVGRLDYNSEGLLLLTDDGDFANKIMHPSRELEKEYEVKIAIDDSIDIEKIVKELSRPIEIDGRLTKGAKVTYRHLDDKVISLRFIIHEGRNRQIRRLCERSSLRVRGLRRIRIGPLSLGTLRSGKYRFLTDGEVRLLKEQIY